MEVTAAQMSGGSSQTSESSSPRTRADNLVASGYVVARRKSTLGSEVTARIVTIFADEGDSVQAGQVVATLDSVLAKSDLETARSRVVANEAAVAAVLADLQDAERIFNRTKILALQGHAAEADLTKAAARVGILRAQLKQADAQFDTARRDAQHSADLLAKYTIYAPFSGIVIQRNAEPGEIIAPTAGSPDSFIRTGICTVVDRNSLEIEVEVNESRIGRVRVGNSVSAVLDAYPEPIPASIIAITPAASREKGTVKVRIAFDRENASILPDMAVKVTFRDQAQSDRGGTLIAPDATR